MAYRKLSKLIILYAKAFPDEKVNPKFEDMVSHYRKVRDMPTCRRSHTDFRLMRFAQESLRSVIQHRHYIKTL